MPLVKVKTKYQIVIPLKFRKQLDIEEGDYVEIEFNEKKDGLVIKPKVVIDKEEARFYSKAQQKKSNPDF